MRVMHQTRGFLNLSFKFSYKLRTFKSLHVKCFKNKKTFFLNFENFLIVTEMRVAVKGPFFGAI